MFQTPEETFRMVFLDMILAARILLQSGAVTDHHFGGLSCGRNSDARKSPSYIRQIGVCVWKPFWDNACVDHHSVYSWRLPDIPSEKMSVTLAVKWMKEMREYGIYPICLVPGERWMTGDPGAKLTMLFQSESDMVVAEGVR